MSARSCREAVNEAAGHRLAVRATSEAGRWNKELKFEPSKGKNTTRYYAMIRDVTHRVAARVSPVAFGPSNTNGRATVVQAVVGMYEICFSQ